MPAQLTQPLHPESALVHAVVYDLIRNGRPRANVSTARIAKLMKARGLSKEDARRTLVAHERLRNAPKVPLDPRVTAPWQPARVRFDPCPFPAVLVELAGKLDNDAVEAALRDLCRLNLLTECVAVHPAEWLRPDGLRAEILPVRDPEVVQLVFEAHAPCAEALGVCGEPDSGFWAVFLDGFPILTWKGGERDFRAYRLPGSDAERREPLLPTQSAQSAAMDDRDASKATPPNYSDVPDDSIPVTWLREQVPQKKVKGDASKLAAWLERRDVRVFKVAGKNHAERAELLRVFNARTKVYKTIEEYDGDGK